MLSLDLMTAPTPLPMAILSPQPMVRSRPLASGEAGKWVHNPIGSDPAAFHPSRACASAETGEPLPCRRRGQGPAGLQMPYRYCCHHIIQCESHSNVSDPQMYWVLVPGGLLPPLKLMPKVRPSSSGDRHGGISRSFAPLDRGVRERWVEDSP